MSEKDSPILILVIGPKGSGKETFARIFKNSFIQGLPRLPLYQGIVSASSFFAVSDLADDDERGFVEMAHRRGYRIVCYVLFAARALCALRNRYESLKEGTVWNGDGFRDDYESFFNSVVSLYPVLETVFFVENQKTLSFVGAYSVEETPVSAFEKSLRALKAETNKLIQKKR